ncbi:MAG: efflux RND transporter periplasmic adaptor subunit [Pyrinomonadaceae bacterium]|nr:efflux RND transporter periplasmic adaptor subunit [Pyrinomonadaceae bacterium]
MSEKQTDEEVIVVGTRPEGGAANTATGIIETQVDAPPRRSRRTAVVIIVTVVAIAATALLLWWFARSSGSGAGRPVPAPRTVAIDQPSDAGGAGGSEAAPGEATLTLPPETMKRAGIRVEPVGEQLAADADGGQVATGVVQPNAYRTTPVVSLVGGIVRRVEAELGEHVRRGETVAVVFGDDLAMRQSEYLKALAELDEHHQHHLRTAKLLEIGAASREEFEQATARLKTTEAEVAAQRQRLLLLGLPSQRVSQLRSSSQVSSEVSLPSPISGTVISRAVNQGEVIEANKEIMRVTDLSSVWVIGQVYERDLAQIRTGSGASITTAAYPGRVFRGRIAYVDPSLDSQTRTAQVRIELANPGEALKIGMFLNVAFGATGGAEKTMPVMPMAAVQNINNRQIVFVATKDPNVFAMRSVKLGPETGDRVLVLEGVGVGERVVTEGSFLLRAEWLKQHPGGA